MNGHQLVLPVESECQSASRGRFPCLQLPTRHKLANVKASYPALLRRQVRGRGRNGGETRVFNGDTRVFTDEAVLPTRR